MSLSEKQAEFASALGKLLVWISAQPNMRVTIGDVQSAPGNTPRHSERSFHYKRLAADLNLFLLDQSTGKWVYQRTTQAHERVGIKWESLGGTWGGRWQDGNHYSWGEGR